MALIAGSRIGVFEVTSPLGRGGMGAVFRARDTRLGRHVALKVLPDEFAADRDRLARFQREAQALAALNHPNIAHIYGLEEAQDTHCIVMELVEGDTLAARLKRGPVKTDEALHLGRQIALALEAAHKKGITHRDLKPSNVMLLGNGDIKVLDFGLAKIRGPEHDTDQTESPTMMTASMPGMILGTAAYISPEQVNGKAADAQSDIWSFGCVLYEMLTGELAFGGDTITEILGSVLKTDPDWNAFPKMPPLVMFLVRRCLEKDRTRRLHDISDVRIAIDEAAAATKAERASAAPAAREMRLEVNTPPTVDRVSLAISPDGQKIVFTANPQGHPRLWLRSLDSTSARPLEGTDYAFFPFWSPDSRSVGFFADSKLKRIDLDGGMVQSLANAPIGRGGAWHRDGTILFAPTAGGPLYRISDRGGEAVPLMRLPSGQVSCRAPQFLPDDRTFIFYVTGNADIRGAYIGQLDGSDARRLLDADSSAVYASSGHLLFVRKGTVFAQTFDPVKREMTGNPFPLAEQVAVDATMSAAALSASAAGPIVFRTGAAGGQRQLIWFDRSGKEIGKVVEPDGANPVNPALSPDGRRVALQRTVNGKQDIWLLELGRGILSRFTLDASNHVTPSWWPDGKHIVFSSNRGGSWDIYRKAVSGAGAEELLLATPDPKGVTDVSPDGRFIAYRNIDPMTGYDIRVLSLEGDQGPSIVVQNPFEERDAQFSPDGKWIAYQSNESGRFEIYVQPFPGPGDRYQISIDGGTQLRWRRDGEELFYIGLDGRLMAVTLRLDSDGQYVDVDEPVALFHTRIGGAVQSNYRQQYAVAPDGQRFLMNTVTHEAGAPITVILNWKARPA